MHLNCWKPFVKRKTSYASRTWRSDWDSPNRAFLGFFDQVEPDPSLETVTRGTHELILNNADAIIALGGGSAIDAAKAMM
jgi:alcohol dehydrogenase YqhD (iron-dependent ADH family)